MTTAWGQCPILFIKSIGLRLYTTRHISLFTNKPIFKNMTEVKDYDNQFSHNPIVLLKFAKLHDNTGHLNVVM